MGLIYINSVWSSCNTYLIYYIAECNLFYSILNSHSSTLSLTSSGIWAVMWPSNIDRQLPQGKWIYSHRAPFISIPLATVLCPLSLHVFFARLSLVCLPVVLQPFSLCACHFIGLSLFLSIWLQGEQMALIHNLVKWVTLMRKDINTERERQEERWRLRKKKEMKAKRFPSCETQLGQQTLELRSLKRFMTTNGNKEISGIQRSTLQCALHRPSSILKTWQEAAVFIYNSNTVKNDFTGHN